ncbi:MAG TPA: nucleotide synthetase [Allosphingosinicella sp.]|nr:nucleotide synthetase [Allosphingosinicella sp.]
MNMATALKEITNVQRNDRAEISLDAPAAPTRYAVREISFALVNGRLQFAFASPERAKPLPPGGIDAVVDGLLSPAPAAMFALGPGRAAPAPTPTPTPTPLDLDVSGDPIWLIYTLAESSNMRFSAALKAMTHKQIEHRPFYGGLRHVTRGVESSQPLVGCRLIYLAAAPPAVAKYRHGFNFNVELEQDPGTDGAPRSLPVEIDPDIRHPGGSLT